MTKTKTFRLNTIDRAELKLLSDFFNCSQTMVVQIALERLATKFITNKELEDTIKDMTTSEYHHDKSGD